MKDWEMELREHRFAFKLLRGEEGGSSGRLVSSVGILLPNETQKQLKQTEKRTKRQSERLTDKQIKIQIDIQTKRKPDSQADPQAENQTEG